MAFDWNTNEEQYKGNFKSYAQDGKYTAKVTSVELKEVGSKGSVVAKFSFQDAEEVQFPTADVFVITSKEGWNMHLNKELFILLGASEENAKRAAETCILGKNKDAQIKALTQVYGKALAKKPEVKIEVYSEEGKDGKFYARADFDTNKVPRSRRSTDPNSFSDDTIAKEAAKAMEEGGDGEISLDSIPF